MPLSETNKIRERRGSAPGSFSPDILQQPRDEQQKEVHEASVPAASSSNDILRLTSRERQRVGKKTSVDSFVQVDHSDAEEEPVLVGKSKDADSVKNLSPFQRKVEAYQRNDLVTYMGEGSGMARFWQGSTIISLLNETRAKQSQEGIYHKYSQDVDRAYKEAGEIIDKIYQKDINNIESHIKECSLKIRTWSDRRDQLVDSLIKEDNPNEKLKGDIAATEKVIEGYREDLKAFNDLKTGLRTMAQQDFTALFKSKVDGLQKTVDGTQQQLSSEQKYQQKHRQWADVFGKARSIFMVRSFFTLPR
ncbi:MAG TPA: hypothetical protein VL485_15320 [Ktedonobacteraceae bacterium]|jgi:hypothetical protein|nr:hypothetical protein [Ktedonobacteraceae bacterium]